VRLIRYLVFHPARSLVVLVAGVALGVGSFYAYQLDRTLDAVAVEDFDPERARVALAPESGDDSAPVIQFGIDDAFDISDLPVVSNPRVVYPNAFGTPLPDEAFDAYLLVGADASGFLADAIIYALQPTGGGAPVMVSLPRDLYVWNACKGRFTRLNEGLGGCRGKASGSELLAVMVEDYTGIRVDHLARVDFDGFARVIDLMGGIRVCVDRPTRDQKAHLEILTTGCQTVGGQVALGWVRSRQAEELVDGEWRRVASSDFTRQRRQQDVLFQLAGRAAEFASPSSLAERLAAVGSSVRLDRSWNLAQAVSTGWRYRGISSGSVRRFTIQVRDIRSPEGAAVLTPRRSFTDQLAEVVSLDGLLRPEAFQPPEDGL
jgi:LCP family protein required for cell wall assembly